MFLFIPIYFPADGLSTGDGDLEQLETLEIEERDVETKAAALPDQKKSNESKRLSRREEARKTAVTQCLTIYYPKHVNANVLRPWSIMHGLIGFGSETKILYNGRLRNAAEYLCENGIGDDRRILTLEDGRIKTNVGPGYQGHEGQLLAMLAQTGVDVEHDLIIEGQQFKVRDLVQHEMDTCRDGTELTFKLIGLSHYLDSNETWENEIGESWTIARLIKEELAQPINGAACGGTHRLMGLSYAVKKRTEQDQPIDGEWARAAQFIKEYQAYAMRFQHEDGSFSSTWFQGKSSSSDIQRQLYTSGHIMEWLVFSLPEEQLDDPRIERGIDFILRLMLNAPNFDLDVGPKGHALHALRIYEDRVFGKSNFTDVTKLPKSIQQNLRRAMRNSENPYRVSPASSQGVPMRGLFRGRR